MEPSTFQYGVNPPPPQYGVNPPPPQYGVNPPPPQYGMSPPPPQYATGLGPVVVPAPQFGKVPVMTTCGNCNANVKFDFIKSCKLKMLSAQITTETITETSAVAWISAAVLCFVFWPCACAPLCMSSLKVR